MDILKKKKNKDAHPFIPELKELFKNGRITRREFLYNATLLGMSATAAYAFVGGMRPIPVKAATIERGGTWKCAMRLALLDHPARASWTEAGNFLRQVAENLTITDSENVTHPLLLEKWKASEDIKTWDLYLRKGVKFNNGDELTADDVIFTMKEWLNPDVGSSMLGLLSYWGGPQNIEKVNDHQIRLHLERPNIAVPEHLFHYAGAIVHRSFEGDFIKQPIGTGPYTLGEFEEGVRAVYNRRDDYWKMGVDGKRLPYLDKIMYIAMDKDAAIAALGSGQIDSMGNPRPSDFLAAKNMKGVTARQTGTSRVQLVRMRVDLAPWSDNRVRTALKMCQDRAKILQLAYWGEGVLGIDAHISPVQPDYCEKPIPKYDPKGARELLQAYASEKGLELPLKVNLATKNDESEPEVAQALKQLAKPGGFDITLDITEPSGYWDRWTEVDFGITVWGHRPLSILLLPLAYTKEAIGNWNETRWYDDEFTRLLRQAQMTLDVEERRQILCTMEDIMQERGPVGVSYWCNVWDLNNSKFHNVRCHPFGFHTYTPDMWKEA